MFHICNSVAQIVASDPFDAQDSRPLHLMGYRYRYEEGIPGGKRVPKLLWLSVGRSR